MRDRTKNKTKLAIPLFIIGIMILSTFGVMIGGLSSDTEVLKYHNFIFKKSNNGYVFNANGQQYYILESPLNVEKFYTEYPIDFLQDINTKKIYLDVSNEKDIEYSGKIYTNLKGKINLDLSCVQGAESERCANLPIKNCSEEQDSIIIIFDSTENKTSIYNNGCMSFYGTKTYLEGVSDTFVMITTGVFNGK